MNIRLCTILLLLVAIFATRLLDVHFHLPPKASTEAPHLVALTLIEAHHHAGEADHGHIAGHLYEGETDEDSGAGLLAKVNGGIVLLVPLLFGLLLLSWRLSAALPLPAYRSDVPPRPRRWAGLAPPSQAPPLQS
ncbi:MAG: hypothetical protein V4709_03445 [Pseudomonadota bacterium]